MNVTEMHQGVRTQFESVAAFTLDNFLDEEIDIYLNRAIRTYVDQQRTQLLRPEETGSSKEANENLRTLIEDEQVTTVSALTGYSNAVALDLTTLSSTFDYYLNARVQEQEGSFALNCQKVSPTQWQELIETRDNEPLHRRPGVLIDSDQLRIALPVDFNTVDWVQVLYLTPPQQVDRGNSTDSDLPDHTHQDIVDLTVRLILRDLGNDDRVNQQQMQQEAA